MRITNPDHSTMPLGDHLEELRRRLFYAVGGILPIFAVGLYFGKTILNFMARPLMAALERAHIGAGSAQVTSALEGFMNYLKIAALLAVIAGGPWIIYQLWRFVAPGLYRRERRFFYLLAPMSVVLTGAGVMFMYYVMLPFVLLFFVDFNANLLTRPPTPVVEVAPGMVLPEVPRFAGDPPSPTPGQFWLNTERRALRIATDGAAPGAPALILGLPLQSESFVAQQYKINEYVNLVLAFALAFALTFQTPVAVLLLGWSGIVTPEALRRQRKYALLACTVVSAAVTPPDIFSMLLLMGPMYALYELGVLCLVLLPAERVARGFRPKGAAPEPGEVADDDEPAEAAP